MKIGSPFPAVLGVLLMYWGLFSRAVLALDYCPELNLLITSMQIDGTQITVCADYNEIPGSYQGQSFTFPYTRWVWSLDGSDYTPNTGTGACAMYTNPNGDIGDITFRLTCRGRLWPHCNAVYSISTNIVVDIEGDGGVGQQIGMKNHCHDDEAVSLELTDDSHSENGFVWRRAPPGMSDTGRAFFYDPSRMMPGAYTVRVESADLAACFDECEINIVKVDIVQDELAVCAEDPLATLNLTSDSYSPNGFHWSSLPPGISGSSQDKMLTFIPSNLPPGRYTISARSANLENCFDVCVVDILKVDLDVDSNNDLEIDATDDLVETDSPGFKFWINDRNSYESIPNTYWESGFGGSSGDDNGDSAINGVRDLEDFAPVRLELAKDLSLPSGYRYQLEIVGPLEIKVFKRVSESYLADLAEAQQQVQEQAWGVVSSAQPLVLDLKKFDADEQYLIFEGVGEGRGTLRLVLRDATGQEVCADEVEIDLVDIRERYSRATTRTSFGQCQETVVSEYGPIQDAAYDPDCDCYARQPIAWETITYDCYQNASFTDNHLDPAKNKVFIWMHGFNVDDDGASIWFDTMFKRLYWSKYDGDFLGISWEGNEGSITQFLTYYNKNVENAFQTAQAVADFVSTVASGKTTDIGAHSLGNMLMLEALRILDKDSSQSVRNVVNMQAAAPGDVYEAESASLVMQLLNSLNAWKGYFRSSIGAAQNSVLNTFSQEDEVLDGVLVLNEFIKPITGIVMFWLWSSNSQAYMHPQMENALGLISVAGQHPSLGSTDVYINQSSSPYGIRDHSSMKNELFFDVEDFFTTLRNTIQ